MPEVQTTNALVVLGREMGSGEYGPDKRISGGSNNDRTLGTSVDASSVKRRINELIRKSLRQDLILE